MCRAKKVENKAVDSSTSEESQALPLMLSSPESRIRHRLGAAIVVEVLSFPETIGVVDAGFDREGGSDKGMGTNGNAKGVLAAWHDLPFR